MEVTIYYLEMHDPAQLRVCARSVAGLRLDRAPLDFELNRQWYQDVGRDWTWTDRLAWSEARWNDYVRQNGFETWVAMLDAEPAGYVELDQQPSTGVEIASFGLLPSFVGRGLGGPFLTAAIERAWQKDSARVWVNTCTLDHPHALANYQARGFALYKTESRFKS